MLGAPASKAVGPALGGVRGFPPEAFGPASKPRDGAVASDSPCASLHDVSSRLRPTTSAVAAEERSRTRRVHCRMCAISARNLVVIRLPCQRESVAGMAAPRPLHRSFDQACTHRNVRRGYVLESTAGACTRHGTRRRACDRCGGRRSFIGKAHDCRGIRRRVHRARRCGAALTVALNELFGRCVADHSSHSTRRAGAHCTRHARVGCLRAGFGAGAPRASHAQPSETDNRCDKEQGPHGHSRWYGFKRLYNTAWCWLRRTCARNRQPVC
jgi:hypothetical protein